MHMEKEGAVALAGVLNKCPQLEWLEYVALPLPCGQLGAGSGMPGALWMAGANLVRALATSGGAAAQLVEQPDRR